jgi:hypothetical protein
MESTGQRLFSSHPKHLKAMKHPLRNSINYLQFKQLNTHQPLRQRLGLSEKKQKSTQCRQYEYSKPASTKIHPLKLFIQIHRRSGPHRLT